MAKLRNDIQNEEPLVARLLITMPKVEKTQNKLNCQVKALIKYHLACANAATKLAKDLKECQ